ncbi:MAG: transglycosylase SLT domain-containing protein, partial [Pseudomonadota bacterium]|nr:transglycosylase SLT domain-containing protein [Pseudomonadota bacterium]
MQPMTRNSVSLAALVLLLAPAVSQANDAAAPQAPASYARQVAQQPATTLTALKADEFKEADLWGRIRTGYAIPDIDNALVAKHVTWYSSRPDYIARTSARASRYLFHVVTELEKRGMPTELALLPIIESAFNPQAYSSANAAGMWQFVPGTGKDFNLKQNMFKDERRGVLASTDAALSYLQKLYGMFGDWQLALAAYNWG